MKIILLPSPPVKRQPASRGKAKVVTQPDRHSKHQDRNQQIATAAYFKAQARGFSPSQALDDWLQAEAELDQQTGE